MQTHSENLLFQVPAIMNHYFPELCNIFLVENTPERQIP